MISKKILYNECNEKHIYYNNKGYIAILLALSPVLCVLPFFITAISSGIGTVDLIFFLLTSLSFFSLMSGFLVLTIEFAGIAPIMEGFKPKRNLDINPKVSLILTWASFIISVALAIFVIVYAFATDETLNSGIIAIVNCVITLICYAFFGIVYYPYTALIAFKNNKNDVNKTIKVLLRYKVLFIEKQEGSEKSLSSKNIIDQLEELKILKEKGFITEEEFEQKRKVILDLSDNDKKD